VFVLFFGFPIAILKGSEKMSKENKNSNIETAAVHAGRVTCPVTGSIIPPIYQR